LQAGVITEVEFDNGAAYLSDSSRWVMDFASVAAWGQKPCRLPQKLNERKEIGQRMGSGRDAEGIQGGDELADETASSVTGVIQDDEPAARPGSV
jgi:hypothetical protein